MRPIIQSQKRIVQQSFFTVLGGATGSIIIARAERDATGAVPDIEIGTVVKAVYCELWLITDALEPGTFVATLEKLPLDATLPIPIGNMTALDTYTNKKNIFYTTQGVVGMNTTNPIPVIRQWINIPKGKQRFGLGDQLIFTVGAQTTEDLEICGVFIYKAYS